MSEKIKIVFIGLGNMGAPMAANLVKKGFDVTVFDLNQDAVANLVAQGANQIDNLSELPENTQLVISMLPAGAHVRNVYLGEQDNGLFYKLASGSLVIDCSTIAATDARELAEAAAKHGIAFLDAPVSGGTAGAAAGTLSFIVGGSAEDFERAKPVLEAMGKNIFHAGGHGSGQVAKICNNMLLGILMAGTSEAIALGVKNGLDAKVLSDIMSKSSGGNWVLNVYNPYPGVMENAPAGRSYQNGFMAALMLKDLNLARSLAESCGSDTPMGEQALAQYNRFVETHEGQLDFSAIIDLYEPGLVK